MLWCCRPAHYVASVYILLFCIYVCELISYAAIWEYASAETLRPGRTRVSIAKTMRPVYVYSGRYTRGWRVTGQYIHGYCIGWNKRAGRVDVSGMESILSYTAILWQKYPSNFLNKNRHNTQT